MSDARNAFVERCGFPLDRFQTDAMDAIDAGSSVVVAAPTGSGKTIVAEYGIERSLSRGRRAFYTAPIKALSNQKYNDLVARYGRDAVGLLTGDNAINGDASVVVMTTEVLRNMIYARSPGLDAVEVVVLDEVHFIQDTYRGPVWEEVIIHLPHHVQLVCLSATVSNTDEVAEWMTTVRGSTRAVIETRRPVDLDVLFMAADRTSDSEHLLPVLVNGRPNNDAGRLFDQGVRPRRRGSYRPRARRVFATPARIEVVDRLQDEDLLPAIYFIFSRNACDEAAASCVRQGVRLTTPDERRRIAAIVDERLGGLDRDDLDVLGYAQFVTQLEAGVASHHAGLVPPFKETVEACFVEGLVKVVFATETLAVGINMPARSVVVEKLSKFTGEHHENLTPGEFTQLTGRAGRRGLDDRGHAVVLWNPFTTFDQVAALAASRSFRLTSSFRPTYNMAVNLVRSYSSDEARHLLNLSLAQFQADRDVVRLEARLEKRLERLDELRAEAESPYGDIHEYRARLEGVPRVRSESAIEFALSRLRPGSVIQVDKGRIIGPAVVLSAAHRAGGVKLSIITGDRSMTNLTARDFSRPPEVSGRVELPVPFAPSRPEFQRDVVEQLSKLVLRGAEAVVVDEDRSAVHPVEDDPDLPLRLRAAAQVDRLEREIDQTREQVKGRGNSVARRFDRVLRVLDDMGYVNGWSLTAKGDVLASTFHESDLLVAEALTGGLLDGLEPADLAALVSVFVYEHRSSEPPPAPWYPSNEVRRRSRAIETISRELRVVEERERLSVHRAPDPTYIAVAYAWASGEDFAEVVEAEELSGGDFVRTMKQLIDLLRQIAVMAPESTTRRSADHGAELLLRGVVAASSAVLGVDS
ncbi:MAG: DEAD/DEAH box helicase [Ilumatobacteraceae bacterium]